jgi:hypothetical protein
MHGVSPNLEHGGLQDQREGAGELGIDDKALLPPNLIQNKEVERLSVDRSGVDYGGGCGRRNVHS